MPLPKRDMHAANHASDLCTSISFTQASNILFPKLLVDELVLKRFQKPGSISTNVLIQTEKQTEPQCCSNHTRPAGGDVTKNTLEIGNKVRSREGRDHRPSPVLKDGRAAVSQAAGGNPVIFLF